MHPVIVGRLASIEAELLQGRGRMDRMETSMSANTEMTSEIRDVIVAAKVGLRVIGGIGTVAKWVAAIAGAVVAVYAALRAIGHLPQIPPK